MRFFCTFVLSCVWCSFVFPITAPVKLLVPATDSHGKVIDSQTTDGTSYPVFRIADDSHLVRSVYHVLETSFAQQVITLDRCARNLLLDQKPTSPSLDLMAPAYLLMSQQEGGFSRHGFWLEDANRKRQLVLAGYVDLVVDEQSINDGNLEEIFSHELAHQILRELIGKLPSGNARNMHQSMTITDNSTAFDEGYAEHFQPLVRDATTNRTLRALAAGSDSTDLDLFWISRLDQQLRTDGIKRNVFIHERVVSFATRSDSDLYHQYLDNQTSTTFLNDELRNGQQMMASEGVIATLFYRIVNAPSLRDPYRDVAFYRPFLRSALTVQSLRQTVSPYQNVNLKLFAAMRAASKAITAGTPPIIAVVNSYATLFPDEASAIYTVLLQTTRGVTVSQELATAFQSASHKGRLGEITAFRSSSRAAFLLLKQIIDRATRGELSLDANLGPELWILNPDFKIAPEIWNSDRTLPLTLNLNTASEVEVMTIPGVDAATAREIVQRRRTRGFFRNLEECTAMLAPDLAQKFVSMWELARISAPVARP